ncbi:MAG: hypothetical protein LBR79_04995 [Oscillospiraceae bacterium]|nr:hypothetical protein [Oscillospiraceae bacterium]
MKTRYYFYFKKFLAYYSCYDLKQPSKINLSVYFLPADGWEKVIKIRRFSNGTAIFKILNFKILGIPATSKDSAKIKSAISI